jgi:hypothetical protein
VEDRCKDVVDEPLAAGEPEPHPASATAAAENSPARQARWHLPNTHDTLPDGLSLMCRSGRSNKSKHGRPPAPAGEHGEPRYAASSEGAADRARSGAEQRPRRTAVAVLDVAHNGTYASLRPTDQVR